MNMVIKQQRVRNPSVGLNFGTLGSTATPATTSAPSGGFGTGLFGSKPTTGFTLGRTNTGIAATITTGLTLGTPATTSASTTGFSLGFSKLAASATPFALPITSTSARGLTLSSALTSTPAASTRFTLNNLGGTTATTTTPSTSLSLGGALAGLGGSLFQSSNTATSGFGQNALGLTLGTTAATSTAGNEGLGGIDFRTSSDKKSDKTGTRPEDSKALKDENLPPVICQDVENLQCPGAFHRRLALERRKTDKAQTEIENENGTTVIDLPGTLSLETDCSRTGTAPAECSLISASLPPWPEEPGLDNPALEENTATDTTQQPVSFPEGKITTIEIHRSDPYIQLGIRIVGGGLAPLNNRYIVIQEVCRDGVITKDGRLLAGEPILQASGDRVDLTIARPGKSQPGNPVQDTGAQGSSQHHAQQPLYHNRPSSHKDLTQCVTCQEKHITVKKEPPESLGMTVAGDRGSKSGELPIFVTSVPAHGCLARDGRIKRGAQSLSTIGLLPPWDDMHL
ncbi:ligand of Numb protein X 2-like [Mustela putorius furo]|uniref:Ligand of Numb protein X 2-like n=1 Tax=Mustela putorius furo TaxID=9669 RepID=A0A8U0SIZ2_MUSPF|nr:ligand of Numb protein X 2-like [Mustela putorius furo]